MPGNGPEIRRTDTGLQYSVLVAGENGARPEPGDLVRFHCSGWLTDGTLFETSRRRAEPLKRFLGVGMPKAWVQGLRLMTKGAKFKVVAPPELGFGRWGTRGKPPEVPPVPKDATLVFEFELIGFEKGIDLPRFRLPDLAQQLTTDSGLKYEFLEAGTGKRPARGEKFTVEFALFNDRGQVVVTSRLPSEGPIVGRQGMKLRGPAFLPEAIGLLKVCALARFEVPPELCYGANDRGYLLPPNSTTIWELRLLKLEPAPAPRTLPKFARLDRNKLVLTESGLRYEVIRAGTGKRPSREDSVVFHFAGWLANGKLFDDSMRKGLPIVMEVSDATPGVSECLQLMRTGGVYRIVVPPRLGYGMHGKKSLGVGPNRTLYYYIDLIEIESPRR